MASVEHSTDDSVLADFARTPDTGRRRWRAKARREASLPPRRSDDDDGVDEDDEDDEHGEHGEHGDLGITCHLCERPCDANVCHMYSGCRFHIVGCWPAVRCYKRLLASREAVEAAHKEMRLRPARWRAEVLPLLRQPGARRDRQARQAVKEKISMNERYTKNEVMETDLILNKKRFKAFMYMWEGQDSDEASEEFDKALQAQGRRWCDDWEDKVKVEGNTEVRRVKGSATSSQTRVTTDAGASSASGSRDDPPPPPPQPPRGGGRAKRDGDGGTTPRGSDAAASRRPDLPRGFAFGAGAGATSTKRRRTPSPADRSEEEEANDTRDEVTPKAKLTKTALAVHDKGSAEAGVTGRQRPAGQTSARSVKGAASKRDFEPEPSAAGRHRIRSKRGASPAASAAAGSDTGLGTPATKLRPVDFMQDKANLARKVAAELAVAKGPKWVCTRIDAVVAKIESRLL